MYKKEEHERALGTRVQDDHVCCMNWSNWFLSATGHELFTMNTIYNLVPRPSASRTRIAYVTLEPLSDSQLSDKGSKVTYAMRARLADGLGTRLHYIHLYVYKLSTPCSAVQKTLQYRTG